MKIKPDIPTTISINTGKDGDKAHSDDVDNKLELMKYVTVVQSTIRDNISSDFVLAKLGDKDKEAIIEMTSNAYYGQKLLGVVANSYKKWVWDESKSEWNFISINKNEKALLNQYRQNLFDSFMTRVFMTTILNRNIDENFLIKILAGVPIDTEEHKEQELNLSAWDKIKDKFRNEERREER